MKIEKIRWEEALPLRHLVLWPNKSPSFCKISGDESAHHYGAYVDGILVSVASIYFESRVARLRKFATLPAYQGKGIGSQIISYILNELKEAEIDSLWCDARKSAASFYQKFGLEKQGQEFDKSGVSYYKMEVQIIP
jgi:predicted GNAT family N-acyltransferase